MDPQVLAQHLSSGQLRAGPQEGTYLRAGGGMVKPSPETIQAAMAGNFNSQGMGKPAWEPQREGTFDAYNPFNMPAPMHGGYDPVGVNPGYTSRPQQQQQGFWGGMYDKAKGYVSNADNWGWLGETFGGGGQDTQSTQSTKSFSDSGFGSLNDDIF